MVQAVALAVHLQNVHVVCEPVEQCVCETFGAEGFRPFLERQIAGDQFGMSDVSAYGTKKRYLLRECSWLIVATEEWTMRKTTKSPGDNIVKDIKRATRKHYSSEEKIRIVLDGLRGEYSIAELCRREGISQGIYYKWSKDFMEAGKKRLAGDTARAANTDEVKELRREAKDLKEVVAEQTLELRLLKKSMFNGGGDPE